MNLYIKNDITEQFHHLQLQWIAQISNITRCLCLYRKKRETKDEKKKTDPKMTSWTLLCLSPSVHEWHKFTQHTYKQVLWSVPLPCDYRLESAYNEIHGQHPVCTSHVHLSSLQLFAPSCIHDEGFLPLLFKLNHKVICSNNSKVSI